MNYRQVLRISRPRFWHYLLGPYVLGIVYAGGVSFEMLWWMLPWGLWYLLCGNIIIYGVNDIADFDTDQHNAKKSTHEELVRPEYHGGLWLWVIASIVIGAAMLFMLPQSELLLGSIIFSLFLFFGLGYSLPPIRAKSVPLVDSVFNILYLLPGLFSFMLLTGTLPPWNIVISGLCWVMGMHVYSAVLDIVSDAKAGLWTTATVLGQQGALYWCFTLYSLSAVMMMLSSVGLGVAMLVYPLLMITTIILPYRLSELYWYFPWVNAMVGCILVVAGSWSIFL